MTRSIEAVEVSEDRGFLGDRQVRTGLGDKTILAPVLGFHPLDELGGGRDGLGPDMLGPDAPRSRPERF
ncbi:hypothetical protein [Cereibacter changlensis]|uniref:hypothetical protein n=1 Tax=Cereibacter changlensis TaxID=402884 RepID=UPI00403374F6